MFEDNFAKQLLSIHLLNATVARQVGGIDEYLQHQPFEMLCDNFFSIQFDETIDSNNDARLIAYVRFCDSMPAVEEIIFSKRIKFKATVFALSATSNDFINEANHRMEKLSRNMHRWCSFDVWKIPKCASTCETKISTVYLDTLQRDVLASKEMSPDLNIVLKTVVNIINY
ncbi:hypothetical protein AVEN_41536-1 [Araneus ventricosus]|uniref:DUF4371 domain-containing protein n=1 Tax=Araneus ventricosus TaxID=182803 RepID=A0A4Y2VZ44_ARAVE|nr:hypothetical protein AVEN_236272-1 [Araneus ventricosus]GBO29050.1 hypothetical protein AVEN_41536-1 [Araneus ventricosus]